MNEETRKRVSFTDREIYQDVNSLEQSPSNIPKGPKFGCRHVQAILLCLSLICGLGTRLNISVAIVAMTDNTTSPNPNVPTYNWNNTSIILSAFFWSYLTFQIAAGYLGSTYGPKYFLLMTSFINCIICGLTPLAAAKIGSGGVIMCRVFQGLCQGFLYPSIHVMLGTWVPDQEKSTLNNIIFSGNGFGAMYATLLTGFISASWWGWEYSFYILACIGFLWCLLWAFLGQNSPASHPRISAEEKRYIQESLKQEDDLQLSVPWKQMFTCPPFYALMAAYIGNAWGITIMTTEIANYLANVMHFDMKSNAMINGIPIVFGLISAFITGPLSDWIVLNNYLSALNSRRIFQVLGSTGQGACLLWLTYLTQANTYMAITILSIANVFISFAFMGYSINHLDLSPRFAGVIFGILNATSQVASMLAPLSAQYFVTDLTNVVQWRIVFIITNGFFGVGSLIFCIFGSATRQPWDGPENKDLLERRKKISVISLTGN